MDVKVLIARFEVDILDGNKSFVLWKVKVRDLLIQHGFARH